MIPAKSDFTLTDLSLSDPLVRARHRNHLSSALAAIVRLLALRETHKETGGHLDWLILPELAVHPDDVQTHLVPFARAHKTIVLAGLTYQSLFLNAPLVNSALWVIPVWSAAQGARVLTIRQGKQHLAPGEETFGSPSPVVQPFRPCQWLVGYEWSSNPADRPLWLTASVCYDATDLQLATDLRGRSDVFAIPALNQDVLTFDQMALALHYHMFQMVIVANNGTYGGSNAYAPFKEHHIKQVFHLHGQPQASAAFLEMEVDEIRAFVDRVTAAKLGAHAAVTPSRTWKFPPAGI